MKKLMEIIAIMAVVVAGIFVIITFISSFIGVLFETGGGNWLIRTMEIMLGFGAIGLGTSLLVEFTYEACKE